MLIKLPFLEQTSPPPFYQAQLDEYRRQELDRWFIGNRSTQYYLKRFHEIDQAGKLIARWHWSAFVMTFAWLLYRKRYMDCFVYMVAGISFIKLTMTLVLALLEFFVVSKLSVEVRMTVRVGVGASIWLFWAVQVGRWADAYYYRMARREIADALSLHPFDKQAQQAYLQKHGGVAWLGMGLAFALFFAMLWVVSFHFLPIIATQKQQSVISDSYRIASHAKHRVERIYQTKGCPVGMPLSVDTQKVTLQVVSSVAGVSTDCAIVVTVQKASFPVRYLNGQTLVLYRLPTQSNEGIWRCQSSLNRKATPKNCLQ